MKIYKEPIIFFGVSINNRELASNSMGTRANIKLKGKIHNFYYRESPLDNPPQRRKSIIVRRKAYIPSRTNIPLME